MPACLRVRHVFALPIYAVALILDCTAAALGCLAAMVAGDDWPSWEPLEKAASHADVKEAWLAMIDAVLKG